MLQFLKNRAFEIDRTTGLVEVLIDFVNLAISHGFTVSSFGLSSCIDLWPRIMSGLGNGGVFG